MSEFISIDELRAREEKQLRPVVFISYNNVEGFKSGSYANGRIFICANDVGRAAFTNDDGSGLDAKRVAERTKFTREYVKELRKRGVSVSLKKADETGYPTVVFREKTKSRIKEAARKAVYKKLGLNPFSLFGDAEVSRQRAGDVMHKLSGRYRGEIPVKKVGLYFVYAGLYAFDQAIGLAKSIKSSSESKAEVIVVSCRCQKNEKRNLLNGTEIKMMESECGGECTMGMLVELFLIIFEPKKGKQTLMLKQMLGK